MTTRKYGQWEPLSSASIQSGTSWVKASYDTKFASNIVYTYANARHNILAVPFMGPLNISQDSYDLVIAPTADGVTFMSLPCNERIVWPGNLRVWIYAATSSEVEANSVRITASIEGYPTYGGILYIKNGVAENVTVSSYTMIHTSTFGWYSIDLNLPDIGSTFVQRQVRNGAGNNYHFPNEGDEQIARLKLKASVAQDTGNVLTVYSVCAYQRQYSSTPTHKNLAAAGNDIAVDDFPRSSALAFLLQDEHSVCYNNRVPKQNVVSHWYRKFYETSPTSYAAAANTLGDYKFVKRAGCSAIYTYACVQEYNNVERYDLKFSIASTTQATATVTSVVHTTGPAYWVGKKFSFSTANTAIEKELELKLCSKSAAGTALAYVQGVAVTESPISATSISHVIPDPCTYRGKSYTTSAQVDEERDTMLSLWGHQPGYCMSDWRVTTFNQPNYVVCSATTASKLDPNPPSSTSACSVVARALIFPSYGCSRLAITVGVQTIRSVQDPYAEMSSTVPMYVWTQISNSTARDTYDWQGPKTYEANDGSLANGYMQSFFNRNADPACNEPFAYRIRAITSPVTAGDWITPSSTMTVASLCQPLQVWVLCWTQDTANYMIPNYVTIEELPLSETEFP